MQTYGYDNTYPLFDPTGTLIFGYDVSANWFTRFNFEASPGTAVGLHQFTGKERDQESGLDYFGARYYGSALGRFTSPDPLLLTRTRLLDPQGLNRYSYARNRSTISIDDGGFGTVLVTVGANQTANVTYVSNSGVSMRSFPGLARGTSRNRLQENGDTPFGKYHVYDYQHGKLGSAYGRAKILMEPVPGQNEALDADPARSDLRIHGGGSNKAIVPNPYADYQPLMGTHGCVRLANCDVEDLQGLFDDEPDGEEDYVYVGTEFSLRVMALSDGTLRQALNTRDRLLNIFSGVRLACGLSETADWYQNGKFIGRTGTSGCN
jgi:RHS repeat-associated protein